MIKDRSDNLWPEALEALRHVDDPRAMVPLEMALHDPNEHVAWAASEALGRIRVASSNKAALNAVLSIKKRKAGDGLTPPNRGAHGSPDDLRAAAVKKIEDARSVLTENRPSSGSGSAPSQANRVGTVTVLRKEVTGKSRATIAPSRSPSATVSLTEGSVADKCRIVRRLGAGSMGTVYLARHEDWDLDVVLKVPNAEILADADHRHRIVREAEAWTDLGLHANIAYCYYVQMITGFPIVVVEYLDGGNLRDWITDGRCSDPKTGVHLAIQACHALEHAHAFGMVHRDVKPENILLTKDGTLKITDFGTVRVHGLPDAAVRTVSRSSVEGFRTIGGIGTYEYMAPEQFADAHTVDTRADIFGLGVCLYEMFCGRRPYELAAGPRQDAPDPRRLRGDDSLPEPLCDLLRECAAWEPGARPNSATELRERLCGIYEEMFGEPSLVVVPPAKALEADSLNNRALSYLVLGKGEKAEQTWQRALEVNPLHAEATYNYHIHLWRAGRTTSDRVVTTLTGLCDARPQAWLPKYLLSQLHLEQEAYSKAKKLLHQIKGVREGRKEVRLAQVAANRAAPVRAKFRISRCTSVNWGFTPRSQTHKKPATD